MSHRESSWSTLIERSLVFCLALSLVLTSSVVAKPYVYLDYAAIHQRLSALASEHPNYVKLDTAQEQFGLPHIGECAELNSTEFGGTVPAPCKIFIVTLTNHSSLASDPERPEILVSGELHGDEIVGPHAVLAYIDLVLSRVAKKDAYFTRMLNTRLVTLLPMTNAVGFHNRERGERHAPKPAAPIDPNRDFAFDQNASSCMVTVAARAVNELFRTHLFRILITFHGGTNVIAYEWGDMTHCEQYNCKPAPDALIMDALAKRLSAYAGPAGPFEGAYPTGTMGALVYPVHGGMEDWAYGASWSGQAVTCRPSTFQGYPSAKTQYSDGTNRCVTYLVETSQRKAPDAEWLGDSKDVLVSGAVGDGHVPRNVRLLVAAVDAVEPYVWFGPKDFSRDDTIVTDPLVEISSGNESASVQWSVGGAFSVDGTQLQWSDAAGSNHGVSSPAKGSAGLLFGGPNTSHFQLKISNLSLSQPVLYFRVAAAVDRSLGQAPADAEPRVQVQSHLMASRINSNWQYKVDGRQVRGRRLFYSDTIRAHMDPASGKIFYVIDNSIAWGQSSGALVAPTVEVTAVSLLGGDTDDAKGPTGAAGDGKSPAFSDPRDRNAFFSGIVGVAILMVVTLAICVKMVKHYRASSYMTSRAAFTLDDDAEMNELKEPLHVSDAEIELSDASVPSNAVSNA